MKILVADDRPLGLQMMTTFLEKEGHEVVTAENGAKAVEQFSATSPDMILMDVVMPVMDGFEATSKIRMLAEGKTVPIVLISISSEENDLILGVSSGADDYLLKPVRFDLLRFKIRTLSEKAYRENLLRKNMDQLKKWHEKSNEEIQLAKHVMKKLIRSKDQDQDQDQDQVFQWILPAESFSGDIIATATTPGNRRYLMLADGTGHGLSAALCMMPVTEIFYAMTDRGFPIATIAEELNLKMNRLLPTERFVAATLVAVDGVAETIEIWNGGGPEVYFISEKGERLKTWKSQHLPLGILSEAQFDGKIELFQWKTPGQLFLCSDGLLDARDAGENAFGEHQFLQALATPQSRKRFEKVQQAVIAHLDGKPCHDDISLVAIQCRKTRGRTRISKTMSKRMANGLPQSWRLDIHLTPTDVKKLEPLPMLLTWFKQVGVTHDDCQKLFIVFSELYNNALDHGLLKLDSALKSRSNGFEAYLDCRSRRLNKLKRGTIDIHLERIRKAGGDFLKIVMKDSGAGFSESVQEGMLKGTEMPSGRGILLVKSMTEELRYANGGNEVNVLYRLNQSSELAEE
ncbi:MAG: SpoIIE family protein phosphatase [Nitrospiria bacterium]